jgi:hypothetical protein
MVAFATSAFADTRDPSAAEALFRSAREAMAKGDYATACPRFAESQRLDPAPGTLLNVASCEEKQGKLATSFAHFSEAADGLPKDDFRVAYAREQIAKLEPRLPMLTVTLADGSAGAHVLRDDVELRSGSFGVALPVDPGTHVLVVRADGRPDTRQEVTLAEGQRLTVQLTAGSAPSAKPASEAGVSTSERSLALPIAAFTVGGVGLATGIVTGLLFKSAADDFHHHCDATGCDPDGMSAASRAKTFNVVSPIAFAVGVVGIGAGTYFLVTSKKSAPPRAGVDVHPYVSPAVAGLSLDGSF